MNENKIPVTIITGFLGAGKTTLLNHINQEFSDKKFAIIENEFGEIGIDNDLVVGVEDGIFEMSNGCICCELNDDLVEVLIKILNRKDEIDHLIIETTGMAEPDGVAAAFVTDPEVQHYFRLDGTICLADANHILDMVEERPEAKKQVTFADHIIINKQNDVDTNYIEDIKKALKKMNPLASVEAVDYSRTESDILSLYAYDSKTIEERLAQASDHLHPDHVCHAHCTHEHVDHHDREQRDEKGHRHHHHSDVVSHSFIIDEPFDLLKFRHWMNILLMLQGARIYRVKGIIHFMYKEERMIVQSVKNMHTFQAGAPWGTEKKQSKIVFIGLGLKREELERSLNSCLFSESQFG